MPKVSARSRSSSNLSFKVDGTKFSCHVCDKNFDRSSDYRRHERTHTGEKPHKCTWAGCTKTFAQSSGLKTHVNTHTGEQPHHCGYCEAKFGDPSSRSRHRREVHGDEGTHECPYAGCHSTIKRPKMFYDHVYEKHNVRLTPDQIDACNPYIRNGIIQRKRRSGRRSTSTKFTRAKVSKSNLVLASSPLATAFAGGIEDPPVLDLPVPLAVPSVPEFHRNHSTGNMYRSYDMSSPFSTTPGQSSRSVSSSPSSIYRLDNRQVEQVYNSPHASATHLSPFISMQDQFDPNYLIVPHSYSGASSSRSYSPIDSPALTCGSSDASSSVSLSPAPEMTRLYSTVHHATPEPDYMSEYPLSMGQGSGVASGTLNLKEPNDVQMEMFLASLNEEIDSYGMTLEYCAQDSSFPGMSTVG